MEIYLAEHRGFCFGVKRAVQIAEENSGKADRVYTLGPIIHNPQLVERLAHKGVLVADNLANVEDGTIIIRSHGVGPETYHQARDKHITILDATCPHVKKAQQAAHKMTQDGYHVIVVGEKSHPEVKSIVEWADNSASVVETPFEAESLPCHSRLGVVAQTTFAGQEFNTIVDILKTKCDEIKIERTICNATEVRQHAAVDLAHKVDIMIIIGGKNSANTSRLAELCRPVCHRVYHIETAAELSVDWFKEVRKAGVTAGASTPDWIIEEVLHKMQEFDEMLNQECKKLEPGDIVKAKIVAVRKDEVVVDIGYKAEGVIALAELSYPAPENASDAVVEGETVEAYVIKADSDDGAVILSKVKADRILAWDKLKHAQENNLPVEVQVTQAVKGGLSAAVFGIRGFIPASQIGLNFIENLEQFTGQVMTVKVIEIDSTKNKVILSRRAILEEERRQREAELFSQLEENQTIDGVVKRIVKFGAFVDIGGVDGLVHISDLSWERVKSPADVVSVGDKVKVVVLKLDPEARKISLGLKQVTRDPWYESAEKFAEGTVVKGKVTKIAKFGAFVEIARGVEGLVHIGELSDHKVLNPADIVNAGQEVSVKILSIDKQSKRIALSIAQAAQDAERAEYQKYIDNKPTSMGATIGEKFGYLFKRED
jgi:small subunit ribosomal protein S1